MIGELFKTTLKRNWLLWVIFFGVLTMYLLVMATMFDPDNMQELSNMMELFPEEMRNSMGFSGAVTSLTTYLASWLYGLLMMGFPMVYCIILGNRLVAQMVDNGSFAYLLSTPHSRVRIIITQGVYALVSVVAMFAAVFGTGVCICAAMFPGLLDVGAFLQLNITTMLVNMTVIMICFFFSCLFNESKTASGFGAGVPIMFLLINMIGGASADAKPLQKLSIYGLYDPVGLVNGDPVWAQNLFYVAASVLLFVAGTLIFRRKRLPL